MYDNVPINQPVCRGSQDEIRVSKIHGGAILWYHLDCFAQVREDLKFLLPADKLPGFDTLSDADQSRVKTTLVEIQKKADNKTQVTPSEICSKVKNALPKLELDAEMLKVKKSQNETMYEYRDKLALLKPSALRKLMRANGLEFPEKAVSHTRSM